MPTVIGSTFQTRNDLAAEVRQRVVDLLNQRLAETLDLYTQCKHAHWNVKGERFFQLHELFDQLAKDVFGFIDEIAERATALGGYAKGTVRMASAGSQLIEFPADAVDGQQCLEVLIERFARYAADNRRAIDTAQNEDDMATADLLTEVARAIDKDLWFLEAHVQRQAQRAG
jgi:starvation-inducible DNA-binding protein